jgi:glycosyltransferase involved in cell wall biosynthesis
MKIDVLANDGSALSVTMSTLMGDDPQQIGVGGAEYAILTLCELWHNRGDKVRFYNNPRMIGLSPFEQADIATFDPNEDRDVLVIFRSPNHRIYNGAKGLKLWWSHDQFTIGNFKEFATKVDKIVVNSPFHAKYFAETYGITNTIIIDEPVRTWEYEKEVPKIPKRCIFTSVPDRGLKELLTMWPHIVHRVPEASLVITSDYRLWGVGYAGNEEYVRFVMGMPNVTMLGAVKRPRLIEEQLKAEYLLYPSVYDELFCYAVAEAECAGVFPITTKRAALATTNMGWFAEQEDFINTVIFALETPTDGFTTRLFKKKVLTRFSPERILAEWDKVFGL